VVTFSDRSESTPSRSISPRRPRPWRAAPADPRPTPSAQRRAARRSHATTARRRPEPELEKRFEREASQLAPAGGPPPVAGCRRDAGDRGRPIGGSSFVTVAPGVRSSSGSVVWRATRSQCRDFFSRRRMAFRSIAQRVLPHRYTARMRAATVLLGAGCPHSAVPHLVLRRASEGVAGERPAVARCDARCPILDMPRGGDRAPPCARLRARRVGRSSRPECRSVRSARGFPTRTLHGCAAAMSARCRAALTRRWPAPRSADEHRRSRRRRGRRGRDCTRGRGSSARPLRGVRPAAPRSQPPRPAHGGRPGARSPARLLALCRSCHLRLAQALIPPEYAATRSGSR